MVYSIIRALETFLTALETSTVKPILQEGKRRRDQAAPVVGRTPLALSNFVAPTSMIVSYVENNESTTCTDARLKGKNLKKQMRKMAKFLFLSMQL